jgi:hypothetical protein
VSNGRIPRRSSGVVGSAALYLPLISALPNSAANPVRRTFVHAWSFVYQAAGRGD